jgi:apolipoprotein D and lipocalin family protein
VKKCYQASPRTVMASILVAATLLLSGCLGMHESVTPVDGFELNRYLGTWHEIARLDHSFERGLEKVTAEYVLRDDGGVSVINRGYSAENQAWKTAEGRAYFVDEPTVGHLKVSFFGPFYASYVIFELDQENYDYAFVSGPDLSYLWLLSRSPEVEPELYKHFVATASQLGFDTDALIVVKQE